MTTFTQARKWLLWNLLSGKLPPDSNVEILRKVFLLNLMGIIGSIILILMSLISFFQKDYTLCAVDMILPVLLIGLVLLFRKGFRPELAGKIGTVATGIVFFFLLFYGGSEKFLFVWSFSYPSVTLFLMGTAVGSLLSLTFLGLVVVVFISGNWIAMPAPISVDFIVRYIPAYFAIYIFSLVMEASRAIVYRRLVTVNRELETANTENQELIRELSETINEIKTLQGILPICANCKKIRNDRGYWEQVEKYVQDHSRATFSHGICPECAAKLYPEFD